MQDHRRRRRAWYSGLVVAGLTLALTAVFLPGRAKADKPEEVTVEGVSPATDLQAFWNDYLNSGEGLTGADSTYSVGLPDGRRAFLFSDSFLYALNGDGSRPYCGPLVNQSMVIQDGQELTTVHGGTRENPESMVGPTPAPPSPPCPQQPAHDFWYWSGDGTVVGDQLHVFYLKFVRTGSGSLDFAWESTAIGTYSLPGMEFQGLTPTHSETKVTWGSAILEKGGHTYVYGVEDHGNQGKYMHVARVPGKRLLDAGKWQFWTGEGWSRDPAASARVLGNVANEYSVTPVGDEYMLVTHDTSEPFGNQIVAWFADSPTGPFERRTPLYETPETGGNVWTYNAHAHPGLSGDPERLIVSYNVNSLVFDDIIEDVSIYRPRFIEVELDLG